MENDSLIAYLEMMTAGMARLVVDVLPRKAEAYAVAEGGLKEVADLCEGRSEESIESVGTNIRLVKADGGGFSVKKRERPPCEEERENYHIDRKSTLYYLLVGPPDHARCPLPRFEILARTGDDSIRPRLDGEDIRLNVPLVLEP
ncbi:sugar fermentation stimulation protein homolog [Striga asiatica]|uniref:Sugar fermentation stimulation protein homolog n=1 Tax=Striga asiatica TaxID=4170 RepID=A0A5A7PEZ8_STRAF|nr:sugar fermentation stimulation protein homolog [Striga asiatica]